MPRFDHEPKTFQVTITMQMNGLPVEHFLKYLNREIGDAMKRVQFNTAAGSKALDITVKEIPARKKAA